MGSMEGTFDGMVVGSRDGSSVNIGGLGTGAMLGLSSNGNSVGKNVGVLVCKKEGASGGPVLSDGVRDSLFVGKNVGTVEGTFDGMVVGSRDGSSVNIGGLGTGAMLGLSSNGNSVGKNVGVLVCKKEGASGGLVLSDGARDSLFVGKNVGDSRGDSVGKNVGTLVGDSLSVG